MPRRPRGVPLHHGGSRRAGRIRGRRDATRDERERRPPRRRRRNFSNPRSASSALVLKPSVLGGFEPCAAAAAAARNRGVAAVVSAAFESGVGVAACAHLAAALAPPPPTPPSDFRTRTRTTRTRTTRTRTTRTRTTRTRHPSARPSRVSRPPRTGSGLALGSTGTCVTRRARPRRDSGAGVGVALRDAGFVAALTDAVSPRARPRRRGVWRRSTRCLRVVGRTGFGCWIRIPTRRRRRRRFCCTDSWARRRIGTPSPRASREPEDESSRWIFRRTAAPRSSATRRRGSRSKPSRTPARDSSRERRRTRRKKRPRPRR